jgi:hypothetical protein
MAASFTPLQPTLALRMVILGLCAAPRPLKPISWCYQQRGSLVLGSVCCNRRQEVFYSTCFSTLRSRSVCLCGLQLYGWALVPPRRFQITALDRGSSSRAEIWWSDLLERWHPMTLPRSKSLSSSVRLIYYHCLSIEIAWCCAWFYTPVSNRCGWNGQIHGFEGVSAYFLYIYSVCYIIGGCFSWMDFHISGSG